MSFCGLFCFVDDLKASKAFWSGERSSLAVSDAKSATEEATVAAAAASATGAGAGSSGLFSTGASFFGTKGDTSSFVSMLSFKSSSTGANGLGSSTGAFPEKELDDFVDSEAAKSSSLAEFAVAEPLQLKAQLALPVKISQQCHLVLILTRTSLVMSVKRASDCIHER